MKMDLKIINMNLESGLGITKGYYQYINLWIRGFKPNSSKYITNASNFIKNESPDIVFITEVDQSSKRSGFVNQLDLINKKFQKNTIFFPTTNYKNFWNQGSAIITSHTILSSYNHELPGKGERRVLGEVNIKIKNKTVTIFVAHIGLTKALRKVQLKKIEEIISNKTNPIIFGGDLNTTDINELTPIINSGLKKYITAKTYPSWKPIRHLDYIFLSNHFEILEYFTYSDRIFSDHLPLIANIKINSM